jgi:hypothetical protein
VHVLDELDPAQQSDAGLRDSAGTTASTASLPSGTPVKAVVMQHAVVCQSPRAAATLKAAEDGQNGHQLS